MAASEPASLAVVEFVDKVHEWIIDGQTVQVVQTFESHSNGLEACRLNFSLPAPQRFNVSVRVPDDCRDACVALNGQMLIGWFDGREPVLLPDIKTSGCQDGGAPISTLRPGEWQNISFRWQDGDRLVFFWVR